MLSTKELNRIVEAVEESTAAKEKLISQEDFEALCESVAEGQELEFQNDLLEDKIEQQEEEIRDLTIELEALVDPVEY